VSDITGSELKEKSWHICRTNDVIGTVLRVSVTADCLQASFVEKS